MRYVLLLLAVFLMAPVTFAQHTIKVTVKNEESKQPVAGATVSLKDAGITATTDANGKAELTDIPTGPQVIEVFSPGFETKELKLTFPLVEQSEQIVFIRVNNEIGEATITSTARISREIDDVPTRIEAINEE